MKYALFYEFKEPVEENKKRDKEIEKGREERGETFTTRGELVAAYWLLSEDKGLMIVDTDDPTQIAKWGAAYGPILKYKISPIMTQEEYEKVTQ